MKQGLRDRLAEKVKGATRRQRLVAVAAVLALIVAGTTALALAPLSFTLEGGESAAVGVGQEATAGGVSGAASGDGTQTTATGGATSTGTSAPAAVAPAATPTAPAATTAAVPTPTPKVTYLVHFDGNGADAGSTMEDAKATADQGAKWELALPASTLKREGYRQVGWSTTADGKDVPDDPATRNVDESLKAMAVPDATKLKGWEFDLDSDGDGKAETYSLTYAAKDDATKASDGAQTAQVVTLYAQWEKDPEAQEDEGEDGKDATSDNQDGDQETAEAQDGQDEAVGEDEANTADALAEAPVAALAAPAPGTNILMDATGPTAVEVTVASGTWGDVAWQVLSADGGQTCRLVLSGQGSTPTNGYVSGYNYYNGVLSTYYYSSDTRPWKDYLDRITQVEVGEGITALTKGALCQMPKLQAATLPSTMTSIPQGLFAGDTSLVSVTFPQGSTLTSINEDAFVLCSSLQAFDFPEGLKGIDVSAFAKTGLVNVILPASCNYIGYSGAYYPSDGVFALCPNLRQVVAPGVTSLSSYAFYGDANLTQATIAQVKAIGAGAFEGTGITSVSAHDDETSVRVSESLTTIGKGAFANTPSLTSIDLPSTLTRADSVLKGAQALSTLAIHTADLTKLDSSGSAFVPQSKADSLDVTFGSELDTLSGTVLQDLASSGKARFAFAGPNTFAYTVGSASLDEVSQPLYSLVDGTYYVDENGLLYLLDTTAKTAKLCYVPFGATKATVPASLTIEGESDAARNGTYTVTGVGIRALASASDLKSLSVENPAALTSVALDAFASCPSLTSFNGVTSKAEAEALLTGVTSTGGGRFANTGLTGDVADNGLVRTAGTIEVESQGVKATVSLGRDTAETQHDPAQDDDGVHQYYTSAHGVMTVSVSTPDGQQSQGTTTRVYLQFSDADGAINWPLGTQQVTDDSTGTKVDVTFSRCADQANTLVVDIPTPEAGTTFSFNTSLTYPGPGSDGGTVKITTKVLSADEKESLGLGYVLPDDSTNGTKEYIEGSWDTKPDDYQTSKEAGQNASIAQDTAGDYYVDGMTFTVADKRVADKVDETFGKDYVKYVTYDDVLQLPEGASWNADLVQAIRDGAYTVSYTSSSYAGNKAELQVNRGGSPATVLTVVAPSASTPVTGLALSVDGAGAVHATWTSENTTGGTSDIGTQSFTLTFGTDAVMVDEAQATSTAGVTITNQVTSVADRYHSGPVTQEATAPVTVVTSDPSLTISKRDAGSDTMGGYHYYPLTVQNEGGRRYDGPITLDDSLFYNAYVTGGDLDAMYGQLAQGDMLELTISRARLFSATSQTVTDTTGTGRTTSLPSSGDGTSYGKPNPAQGSTDEPDLVAKNCTITIVSDPQNPGHATVTLVSGTNADGTATQQRSQEVSSGSAAMALLAQWGYAPTNDTVYGVALKTHDLALARHDSYQFTVHCHWKSSFMMTTTDTEGWIGYPSNGYYNVYNTARLTDKSGKRSSSNDVRSSVSKDLKVDKTASYSDETDPGTGGTTARLSTYTLSYTAPSWGGYGAEEHDALPLVDSLSGSQAILAPVDLNPGLEGKGLGKCTVDGTTYWTINQPGTYRTVKVGTGKSGEQLTADTITVTAQEDGTFSTVAKWYFHEDFSRDLNRQVTFTTRTVLDWKEGETSRLLEDVVFLGDHGSHRLWERYGETAERYGIDKKIVTDKKVEADPADDATTEMSVMRGGEAITYRLKIHNYSDAVTVFDAAQLRDKLPLAGGWAWSRDNVQVAFANTNAFSAQGNTDAWYLTQDDGSGATEKGQYYLVFGGTGDQACQLVVQPNADAYIYVTLTPPAGDAWETFAAAHTSDTLTNTFQAFGKEASVHHEVAGHGSAFLQKGVLATSTRTNADSMQDLTTEWARTYYSNTDTQNNFITYYITIGNSGTSRLYLNDVQDTLPKGFIFSQMRDSAYETYNDGSRYAFRDNWNSDKKSGTTSTGNYDTWPTTRLSDSVTMPDGSAYQVVSCNVTGTSQAATDQGQKVTFSFGSYTGNYNPGPSLSYDEKVGKYYLLPGQVITFGAIVYTNTKDKTADVMTNQAGMELDQHAMTDFSLDTDSQVKTYNPASVRTNDGGRDLQSASDVAAYGFESTSASSQWLTSNVTVRRGDVVPGITKEATSRTDATTGNTTTSPNGALSTDTIGWTVRATNSGPLTMQGYVLSDVVQKPYLLTGDVNLTIDQPRLDGSSGTVRAFPYSDKYSKLFTIKDTTVADDGTTTVTVEDSNGSTRTLSFSPGRPSVAVILDARYSEYDRYRDFYLTMRYDDNGNEVLSVKLEDEVFALRSGATATLTVSSKNTSGSVSNGVFYNTSYITPVGQSFNTDAVTRGSVVDFDVPTTYAYNTPANLTTLPSVRSSSLINVSYGYITSSVKRVTQKDDPTNAAASNTVDNNAITLPTRDKAFTYSLDVGNTTGKDMSSLVLIDSLPQRGDHSVFVDTLARDSEYQVDFASDPQPVVTVTEKDGTTRTLDPSTYKVEYSDATSFADADWEGMGSGTGWGTDSAGKRSLRVTIGGTGPTAGSAHIPADATVTVSFDAVVSADAQTSAAPGAIAWNSFGCRYGLEGVAQMLLSAPLNVGVRLPYAPSVAKQLVGSDGTPATAKGDHTFSYLAFEGGLDGLMLDGQAVDATRLDSLNDSQLAQALAESGRKATYLQVTVPDGKSASDPVSLWGAHVASYDAVTGTWVAGGEEFPLTDGATYTLTELGLDQAGATANGLWRAKSMELTGGATLASGKRFVSFAYSYKVAQRVTSTNERNVWRVDLTKRGALSAQPLEGAVFALYSPNKADLIPVEEFEKDRTDWGLSQTYLESMGMTGDGTTGVNGTKYYLARLVRTDANGTLALKDLDQGTYVLQEFAAPQGYGVVDPVTLAWHQDDAKDVTGTVVRAEDNQASLTLDDPVAYTLPSTGGTGVAPFALVAAGLMGLAALVRRGARS